MSALQRLLLTLFGCAAASLSSACDDPPQGEQTAVSEPGGAAQQPVAPDADEAESAAALRPVTLYRDAYEQARKEITADGASDVLDDINAQIERESEERP